MPHTLRMPEVAANATHATLVCWNKKIGDRVEAGQSIADVETDKAIIELPVEQGGVIAQLLVDPGAEVPVGEPIAILYTDGESSENDSKSSQVPCATVEPEKLRSEPTRVFSSPVARLLAVQNEINLANVAGSGPKGRVTKHDVTQHIERINANTPVRSTTEVVKSAVLPPPLLPNPIPATLAAPSATRRTIAKRLAQSKSEVPHFYLRADCRVDELMAAREQINQNRDQSISINDFVIRAAAVALTQVPQLNVSWREEGVLTFLRTDISVAVDTPSGLLTPIICNAAEKTLSAISAEMRELASQARAGKLRLDQFQGGTFSISNLGMFGIADFDAIINQPQAAILAVGAVRTIPIVCNDTVVPGRVMSVVLSVDHRVIDGSTAARWLTAFRTLIEQPLQMLA